MTLEELDGYVNHPIREIEELNGWLQSPVIQIYENEPSIILIDSDTESESSVESS